MTARVCMLVFNAFEHDSRVLKQAGSLVTAGCDVRVVCHRAPGLAIDEVVDHIRVRRVGAEPSIARALKRAASARASHARDTGRQSAVTAFPPTANASSAELAARRQLVAMTRMCFWRNAASEALCEPMDLVVAHDLDTLLVATFVAWRARARLIYDSHELFLEQPAIVPWARLQRRRWAWVERRFARKADQVITVNDSIADELERRYGIARPAVIRNVPETDGLPIAPRSGWRAELKIPDSDPLILVIGGVDERRGYEELIEAIGQLSRGVLVLLGPASTGYIERLQRIALASGHNDRLRWVRPVPAREVLSYAATADVGVVPYRAVSLNHWFSLPTKLFDYIAAGVPVVTGAFPELTRVVDGYGLGQTCDTDDPKSIAQALQVVIDDSGRLRDRAAAAAREFTWTNEGAAYLQLVTPLLDGEPRHGGSPGWGL